MAKLAIVKWAIYLLILLITVSSASAVAFNSSSIRTNCTTGYDFNSGTPLVDICKGLVNLTANEVTNGGGGKYNNAAWFNWGAAAAYARNTNGLVASLPSNFSISQWVYWNSTAGATDPYFLGTQDNIRFDFFLTTSAAPNDIVLQIRGAPANCVVKLWPPSTSGWRHLAFSFDDVTDNFTVYWNGVLTNSTICSGGGFTPTEDGVNNKFVLGNHYDATGEPHQGGIDDWAFFNGLIFTPCMVAELYDGSCTTTPPATAFTVTAQDIQNTSKTINTLNISIEGYGNFSTTNGSVLSGIFSNATSLYNITVQAECGSTFCNYSQATYYNWNASQNLKANLTYWYSVNYTQLLYIGEYETQTLTLRVNHSNASFIHAITDVSAALRLHNITYTATKSSNSNYTIFEVTTSTPYVGTNTNISGTWLINVTRAIGASSETGRTNKTFYQNVYQIGIDNCSSYPTVAMNMSIYNETDSTLVTTADINGYFKVWVNSSSSYREFNLTWGSSQKSYSICIYPNNAVYNVYAQMVYGATGFYDETHYLTDATLNNAVDYLNLYLTQSSSLVTFTVKDENDDLISGAYIYIMAYDVTTNTAKTTEILKTGTDGTAVGHILLNLQAYKFTIVYNGEVKLETVNPGVILTGTTYNFRITVGTDYFATYDVAKDVACLILFSNTTRTFTYTFTDTTGNVAQGCFDVTRLYRATSSVVNSSCLSSSSGTINLIISNNTQTATYTAAGYVVIDGDNYPCGNSTSYEYNRTFETFDLEGAFASFFLILTLVLAGLWSPVASLILLLVGLIGSIYLGIFHMGWFALSGIIAGVIITIYKVSSR